MQNTISDHGERKKAFVVFGVIIVVCITTVSVHGLSKSRIDLRGRNFVVQFEEPVEPEIRQSLMM